MQTLAYLVVKRLILPISNRFPAFVRYPVSGVMCVVTKKQHNLITR